MPSEPPGNPNAEFGNLPQFPGETNDAGREAKPRDDLPRRRWWFVLGFLGALGGLTCGVPESPRVLRFPGYLVGLLFRRIPDLPEWVFTVVAPVIGWGILGGLLGWAFDEMARQRERRDRLFRD